LKWSWSANDFVSSGVLEQVIACVFVCVCVCVCVCACVSAPHPLMLANTGEHRCHTDSTMGRRD